MSNHVNLRRSPNRHALRTYNLQRAYSLRMMKKAIKVGEMQAKSPAPQQRINSLRTEMGQAFNLPMPFSSLC